jgi:predicted N-acetyltransferase YhbS
MRVPLLAGGEIARTGAVDEVDALFAAVPDLSPSLATAYWDAGAVYTFHGVTFVASVFRDDVLERAYAYIPAATAPLDAAHGFSNALASEILSRSHVDAVVVRVPAGASEEAFVGWELLARYIVKEPHPVDAGEADDLAIAMVTRETADAVRALLVDALVLGYGPESVARANAQRFVDETFRFDGTDDHQALVAVKEGTPIGHVTWNPHVVDDVTGEPFVELVDVAVLDTWEGRGVGARLTNDLEERLVGQGRRLRGNIVADGGVLRPGLVEALQKAEWQPHSDLWRRGRDESDL